MKTIEEILDPITFMESNQGLNQHLFPVQHFIIKCFYGMKLDSKTKNIVVPNDTRTKTLHRFTEKEFLKWLYDNGKCNTTEVTGKNFKELDLVLGRRSGKSLLSACIANYELYKLFQKLNPNVYYELPKTEEISIIVVSPLKEQALNILYMMKQYKQVIKNNAKIKIRGAGCSSTDIRGRMAILIIFDEMAYFFNNSDDAYKAITPFTLYFKNDGKIICASSPNKKQGKFYERYLSSFYEPDKTLMFKMYSSMLNPMIDSKILIDEKKSDRKTFLSEYGGEFQI